MSIIISSLLSRSILDLRELGRDPEPGIENKTFSVNSTKYCRQKCFPLAGKSSLLIFVIVLSEALMQLEEHPKNGNLKTNI